MTSYINYSRPERVWEVTSRLGTGKQLTFFLQCIHLMAIEGFAQHLVPVFLKAQSSPAVFRCILGLWRTPLVPCFLKAHSLGSWHGMTWHTVHGLISYISFMQLVAFSSHFKIYGADFNPSKKLRKSSLQGFWGQKHSHTASNKSSKNYIMHFLTFLQLTF